MTGNRRARASGEGSVYRRGKSWAYLLRTGDGTRAYRGGFRTQAEASEALARERVKVGDGDFVKPHRVTVGDFLMSTWLPAQAGRLKPSTADSYAWIIEARILPRIGSVALQKVSAPALEKLYSDLLSGGSLRPRTPLGAAAPARGLSSKSVREVHVILRKALSDAVKWGMLARNPAEAATPPSAKSSGGARFQVWTAAQVTVFLKQARGHELYPLFYLAACHGMRRGELLGLRWRSVDLNGANPSLTIVEAVVAHRGTVSNSSPKTASGGRTIDIAPQVADLLRAHKRNRQEQRLALGLGALPPDARVFARADESEYRPDSVGQAFQRIAARAGLPRIRFHDLRHSYATIALGQGMSPKVVQEQLGHEDVSITLQTYSHVLPAVHREAAGVVAGLIC